ncbi:hypothetical protein NF348_01535 [Devosia sp. XJ19-45]|uniref:Uncharacterized protein n=1 Tax=Devosia ureilytica TaxID=2952754 RepID=A0A9Q4AKL2_9HYPH|nr:hypothetical protein [Devosia ureilytica]
MFIDDVAGARLSVSKGLAQGTHVHAQARLVDIDLVPGTQQQILVRHQLPCTPHEGDQQVEGTRAKTQFHVPVAKGTCFKIEDEWTELHYDWQ